MYGSNRLNFDVLKPIMAIHCSDPNVMVNCPDGPNRTMGPNMGFQGYRIGNGLKSA